MLTEYNEKLCVFFLMNTNSNQPLMHNPCIIHECPCKFVFCNHRRKCYHFEDLKLEA